MASALAAAVQPRRTGWNASWAAWRALLHLLLLVTAVVVLLPFVWMTLASLKENREVLTYPPTWLPERVRLDNFAAAWNRVPFGRFYLNSAVTTLAGMACGVTNAALCAYAFSFIRFPRRDALFLVVLATMMVPHEVAILPNYLTVSALGW